MVVIRQGAIEMELTRELPGLFIVHHNKPMQELERHAHQCHELIIPISGTCQIVSNGKDFNLTSRDMAFIPANTPHDFKSNGPRGERLIAIMAGELFELKATDLDKFRVLPANQLVKELLYQVLVEENEVHVQVYIKALMTNLATILTQQSRPLDPSTSLVGVKDVRIAKFIDLVRESFGDKISVAALAKRSGISERNLQRLFRDKLGLTPSELVTQLRMEQAHVLLKSGDYNVTETSLAVGYDSLSQFIKTFKAHFGELPSIILRGGA